MSQQWEPPGQQPRPEEQQAATGQPDIPAGGSTAYPPPPADAYPPPPADAYPPPAYPSYPPGYAQPHPQPLVPGYQPYATHPPTPVSGRTTVVAGVIQIVQSAFWLVVGIVLVALSGDPSTFWDESDFDENFTPADGKAVVIVVGLLIALLAASTLTLAILTLRRINGCRIASAVLQTIFGSVGVLSLLAAVADVDPGGLVGSLLLVGSCATAATLLYGHASARYCQARNQGGQPVPSRY